MTVTYYARPDDWRLVDIVDYRSQIEAALVYSGGTHKFEDVERDVEAGKLQFWPGTDSVIITEIQGYPQGLALNFFLAGGSMTELQVMTPPILEWGKSKGCSVATLTGRRGWLRSFLTRTGWKRSPMVIMERRLDVEGR